MATVSCSSSDVGGDSRSLLSLFSVNGSPAASAVCRPAVRAICFSSAPEGLSCNSLATGHANGVVRLWSSWDLSPVRDVDTSQVRKINVVIEPLSRCEDF